MYSILLLGRLRPSRQREKALHHGAGVDGLWLRHGHGHAQRLQRVESRHAGGGNPHGRRCRAVDSRVERVGHVARLRRGRGVIERAELVLARVFLLLLAREVEALAAFAAIVRTLVLC